MKFGLKSGPNSSAGSSARSLRPYPAPQKAATTKQLRVTQPCTYTAAFAIKRKQYNSLSGLTILVNFAANLAHFNSCERIHNIPNVKMVICWQSNGEGVAYSEGRFAGRIKEYSNATSHVFCYESDDNPARAELMAQQQRAHPVSRSPFLKFSKLMSLELSLAELS